MPGDHREPKANRRQAFFEGSSLILAAKIMSEVKHENNRARGTAIKARAEA